MSNFDLNIHTARLLMDEPFFAAISRRIDKRATYAIPTAGVMVNPDSGQFEMLYNPEFFEKLTDDERRCTQARVLSCCFSSCYQSHAREYQCQAMEHCC